jgi:colanic acid/amylovoran biosynthesis protein
VNRVRSVSIVGGALSANKGAAAMVETVMARLPAEMGECRFSLLTTYPDADTPKVPLGTAVDVVGLQPLRLALVEFPVAMLARVARLLRIPLGWVRARGCRAMLDSDVVVDVAGISFADGRGVPILFYNALMTGVPLLLGVPTVKAAQALGPFTSPVNKTLSKLVLPRLSAICARGAKTREHLNSLGLTRVHDVADLAFSLDEAVDLPGEVATRVDALTDGFIVVMPSAVVKGIFESRSGNYVAAMGALIRDLRNRTGLGVVIAPHSYRAGHGEGRMNDGPVCREVAAVVADDPGVVLVDADLTAGELRKIIGLGRVLVTSRFHAMISGLCTATPTVVVGWSHKYREVLSDFGLVDFGMDSTALSSPSDIVERVADAIDNRNIYVGRIESSLPAVRERSARNFAVIASAARS